MKKASKKFYAVCNGKKKGIFDNWSDCKGYVLYYSGSVYKGFEDPLVAYQYILKEMKLTGPYVISLSGEVSEFDNYEDFLDEAEYDLYYAAFKMIGEEHPEKYIRR